MAHRGEALQLDRRVHLWIFVGGSACYARRRVTLPATSSYAAGFLEDQSKLPCGRRKRSV